MDMIITSSAFPHNGAIPKAYTCEGRNISPPLAWYGIWKFLGMKSIVFVWVVLLVHMNFIGQVQVAHSLCVFIRVG